MKKALLLALATLLCAFCGAVFAQDQQPAESAPANASALKESTPEFDKFVDEMNKYKESLKKLRTLKESYQTATAEEKDAIIAEFTPLVEEAQRQQKALVPLGISAYDSVKGDDPELRAFLCSMLHWSVVSREDYETAYQIAKSIFNYPLPENGDLLYAYAAFAAFCTMNLDDAVAWRDVAKEKDVLSTADPERRMNLSANLFDVLPNYQKSWPIEQEIRAEEEKADNLPRVLLHTTKGDITLELFLNQAPIAVNNFLTLVKSGFYTDVPFHRVLPYFMAQGGDPTGTGAGGPGYSIRDEQTRKDARGHFRGSLSMANAGPNTGGSQFFITFTPTAFLNDRHTVFGRVIDGLDVLSDIQRIDPEKESDVAPDKILEAKILRGEPAEFEKLPGR